MSPKKRKKYYATAGAALMALTVMHLADKASGSEVCGTDVYGTPKACAPGETPPTTVLRVVTPYTPGDQTTILHPPVEGHPELAGAPATTAPAQVAAAVTECPVGWTLLRFEDGSSKCDDGSYYGSTTTSAAPVKQAPARKQRSTQHKSTTTTAVQEDDPAFDCATMGNGICYVEVPPWAEPYTFAFTHLEG